MSLVLRVTLYTVLAFAISWAWWIGLILSGARVAPGSTASHLPGLMGPVVAAFVTAWLAEGRAGAARLWRSIVRWPDRAGLAFAAILAPIAVAALVFTVRAARGTPPPPVADFLAYPGLPASLATPAALILVILLNGYGEETGWRGWLFPTLAPRFGAFGAALIVAAIWAVWHLPLFWLNLSMAALVGPMLAGWLIGLVLGSFALAWLWQKTGSVSVLALWHVGYNLCVATPATAGTVAAVVSTAVMLWGAWVVVTWWLRPPQFPRIATT